MTFERTERGNLAIRDPYGHVVVLNVREIAALLSVIELEFKVGVDCD